MIEETKNKKRIALSATLLAAIVLIAIVVANILAWNDHRGMCAEMASLTGEISQAQQRLSETPEPPENLEARLAMAQAELAEAEAAFPDALNRNDVVDYLLNLAEECQVEIVPLMSEGWSGQETGTPYRVLRLNGTVTGTLAQATSFIAELQNSRYATLKITGLTVTRQDNPPDGGSSPGNDTPVTVRLNVALYTRYPAPEDKA